MSVNQWVLKFRDLHERFRAGKLDDIDRRAYFADREQFAKALLNAQGLSMEAGQSARRSFRIAQGMQMDLSFNTGNVRCMTLDISCGGFSVMMHQPPSEQEQPGFSLRMPGNAEPLTGRARFIATQRKIGTHRVSYSFIDLPAKDLERLETVLFDIALERLKG